MAQRDATVLCGAICKNEKLYQDLIGVEGEMGILKVTFAIQVE